MLRTLKTNVLIALSSAEFLEGTLTDPADRRRLEAALVYLRRTAAVMECVYAKSSAPEDQPQTPELPITEDPVSTAGPQSLNEPTQPIAAEAATDIDVEDE